MRDGHPGHLLSQRKTGADDKETEEGELLHGVKEKLHVAADSGGHCATKWQSSNWTNPLRPPSGVLKLLDDLLRGSLPLLQRESSGASCNAARNPRSRNR